MHNEHLRGAGAPPPDPAADPRLSGAPLWSEPGATRARPRSGFPVGAVILLVLLVAIAFGAGMLVERRFAPSMAAFSLPVRAAENEPTEFKTFWQAWEIVQKNYFDRQIVADNRLLTQGSIKGMVEALGDEGHTYYLSPKDAERQRVALAAENSFDGIGAHVTVRDGVIQILAPIDGSPAFKAGVKPGDIVLKVDGEDVRDKTLDYVVSKIRGKAGTPVTITFARPKQDPPQFELTITRGTIPDNPTTLAMLPESKIAFISLAQFNRKADETLKAAIESAKSAAAKGLVIDMRSNPGGLFQQALDVASEFLPEGTVIVQQRSTTKTDTYKASGGGAALDLPLVVLTNRGSASAAEIFAGAIQSAGRGKVVGDRTFGTGTVLNPYQLDDGSAIYLATAEWLTPDGRSLRRGKDAEGGVAPDVAVALPLNVLQLSATEAKGLSEADVFDTKDTQLKEALRLVREATGAAASAAR